MPWSPKEAYGKNNGINDPATARRWSKIANSMLEKSGDDAKALRVANGVIRNSKMGKRIGGQVDTNDSMEAGEANTKFGQHAVQKKGNTKGTVVKMKKGGPVKKMFQTSNDSEENKSGFDVKTKKFSGGGQAEVRKADKIATKRMPANERERLMYGDPLPDESGQNEVRMGRGQLNMDTDLAVRGEQPLMHKNKNFSYDSGAESGARITRGTEKFNKYEHQYSKGGKIDGCAVRGKTRGKMR